MKSDDACAQKSVVSTGPSMFLGQNFGKTSNTNSKYELRSYLESRWRRQSRLAPSETCGFERLLTHPLYSNSSICNLEFELPLKTQFLRGTWY